METYYPLTIVKDRFNGTYSGGKFVAWHCQPCSVPSDTYSREAYEFWEMIHNFENDTEMPYPTYGVGDTIEEAIKNLENKLILKDIFLNELEKLIRPFKFGSNIKIT